MAARPTQTEQQRTQDPEFSVCVETAAGWIYVAEFRTLQEATQLAEGAVGRSQLRTHIRRCGDVVHELQPCLS